jgi:hypothetical protein
MAIKFHTPPAFDFPAVVRNTGLLSKAFTVQLDGGRLHYRFVGVPTSCLRLRLRAHPDTGEVMERDPTQFERVPFDIPRSGTYLLTIEVDTDNATLVGVAEAVSGFLYVAEAELGRDGALMAEAHADGGAYQKQAPQRVSMRMRFVQPETLDGYLAIDIGTTNSTACLYDRSHHIKGTRACPDPLSVDYTTIDGSTAADRTQTLVATDLFVVNPRLLLDEESACVMGIRAQEMAQDASKNLFDSCLIQGAKSVLASDESYQVFYHDGGHDDNCYLTPTDVLAAVVKKLVRHAERTFKKRVCRLILTYPPQWTFTEQNQLREIVQRLQPKDPQSSGRLSLEMDIDEASAAGLYYVYRQNSEPGTHKDFLERISAYRLDDRHADDRHADDREGYRFKTLTFDYGGGTLDLSLVEYLVTRRRVELGEEGSANAGSKQWKTKFSIRLLDSDTLENHGGNAVTLNIFRLLKRKVALAVADWVNAAKDLGNGAAPGQGRGLDRDRRAAMGAKITALASNWKGVLESIKVPALVDTHGADSAIRNARWVVDGTATGPMAQFPRELTSDQEAAVEGVFPTAWINYGDLEREVPRKNARRLWMLAEQLKTDLTREFERELRESVRGKSDRPDAFDITTEAFEQALQKTKIGGVLDTEHFDTLRGLLPTADRDSAELRRAVLGLTIQEVLHCTLPLLSEGLKKVRLMCEAHKGEGPLFQWVTLAGNASRTPLVRYVFSKLLGVDAAQVQFNAADAKLSVAKGACINRIIRGMIPDIEFETHSFATKLARPLELFFAGEPVRIFEAGPIVESQPSRSFWAEELFAEGDDVKTLQVLEYFDFWKRPVIQRFTFRVGGSPPAEATVLPRHTDRPAIAGVMTNLGLKELPDWSEITRRKQDGQLESVLPGTRVTCSRLLQAMEGCDFKDRLSWYESATKAPPPERRSQIRFYLSRERNLYMVEHFADGKRLLYEGQLPLKDEARRDVQKRENPFSGVH